MTRSRAHAPARRPGLTLLEVLIALAIFLMSLVAVAGLVDFGSERGMAAAMQSTGTRLAQSILAEAEAGALPVNAASTGSFEAEPGWSYTVESAAAGPANVYTVTVTCVREVGGRQYQVVLAQMMCDPAQMGTAAAATVPKPAASESGTTTSTGSGQ